MRITQSFGSMMKRFLRRTRRRVLPLALCVGLMTGSAGITLTANRSEAQSVPSGFDYMIVAIDIPIHLLFLDLKLIENYIGAMYGMTEQMAPLMMQQVAIIGSFIDAQDQLDTQRVLQDMEAQTHKAYEPSTQMCIFGTNVRSLAMSDQKAKANAAILNNAMLNRSLLPGEQETGAGRTGDVTSRLAQYKATYCDPNDNDQQLEPLCGAGGAPAKRRNRDISFNSLIEGPLTLKVDFTNADLTDDEEDVLAMSRNLYAHNLPNFVASDLINEGPLVNMGAGAMVFQNYRSLQAVRGVAENSFAHLVGMKAEGGPLVYDYMSKIVEELGVDPADLQNFLGQNPSYFAQMDVLTKRIFMAPEFYVNLFTSPGNVERLGATLQSIKLMNDRDRFEASLRREMLISQILEMKIRDREWITENSMLEAVSSQYVH